MPCDDRGTRAKSLVRSCDEHLRANVPREIIPSGSMSHLKILRGNLARQILNRIYPNECKKIKPSETVSVSVRNLNRNLDTKTVTVLEQNVLSSPWGEITPGKETLTEHVFKDIELWTDSPCVVSAIIYFL